MEQTDNIHEKLIHIELVKSDIQNTQVKKYLPAFVLMASFYYSVLLASGIVIGYTASRIFSKHLLEKGKVDPIFVDCGKWKLHLHHWITGAVILAVMCLVYKFSLTGFLSGIILGVMAHDVYDYNDWPQILVKKESH